MNKIYLLFVAFAFHVGIHAQEASPIRWMTLEEAVKAQQKEPRKIIMDAYTNWCGPCKMLDKNTFHNKDVADYINKNFYPVKFNAEGNDEVTFQGKNFSNPNYDPSRSNSRNSQHELAGYLGVRAYPTVVFLDESAALLFPLVGYQDPNQLELYLKLFATDAYKGITTKEQFEQYIKDFKAEFQL